MPDILTVTVNPALDVTTEVARLEPHVKLRCAAPLREPGGGGVNVSRMIGRLGGRSHAFIAVGGAVGEELRLLVEREGIRVVAHEAPGMTRETLQVVERASGAQYRFVMPGPRWSHEETRRLEAVLVGLVEKGSYRWVVASGSLPPGMPDDLYARLARRLAAKEVRFVLDSSGGALRKAVAAPLALVKPDSEEIATLAADFGCHEGGYESMARALVEAGPVEALIYTRGAEGAVLVRPGETVRWRPPEVEVKSLTGAGDAFLAAVVLALSRGVDMAEATRWGVAAAAATATTEGTGLADRTTVETLFERVTAR